MVGVGGGPLSLFLESCCGLRLFLPRPLLLVPPRGPQSRGPQSRGLRLLPLPPIYPSQVFPPINMLCFESHFGVCFSEDMNQHAGKLVRFNPLNLGLMLPFVSFQTLFLSGEKASSKGQTAHRSSKDTGGETQGQGEQGPGAPPQTRLGARQTGSAGTDTDQEPPQKEWWQLWGVEVG